MAFQNRLQENRVEAGEEEQVTAGAPGVMVVRHDVVDGFEQAGEGERDLGEDDDVGVGGARHVADADVDVALVEFQKRKRTIGTVSSFRFGVARGIWWGWGEGQELEGSECVTIGGFVPSLKGLGRFIGTWSQHSRAGLRLWRPSG